MENEQPNISISTNKILPYFTGVVGVVSIAGLSYSLGWAFLLAYFYELDIVWAISLTGSYDFLINGAIILFPLLLLAVAFSSVLGRIHLDLSNNSTDLAHKPFVAIGCAIVAIVGIYFVSTKTFSYGFFFFIAASGGFAAVSTLIAFVYKMHELHDVKHKRFLVGSTQVSLALLSAIFATVFLGFGVASYSKAEDTFVQVESTAGQGLSVLFMGYERSVCVTRSAEGNDLAKCAILETSDIKNVRIEALLDKENEKGFIFFLAGTSFFIFVWGVSSLFEKS